MSFLKLIRWPNILTIILTEVIIKYVIMDFFLFKTGLNFRLDDFVFIILVFSSIFIAAAGNIINDILDIEIDKANNLTDRPLVNGKISTKNAWFYLLFLSLLGISFAEFSAILVGNWANFSFQVLILTLLFLYSYSLKCKKMYGNIAISFVTSMVPILIWFYTINNNGNQGLMFNYSLRWMHFTVWFYAGFAFLSNFIRELVKDKEDANADLSVNCKTWAATASKIKFRGVIMSCLIVLLITIFTFQILSPQNIIFRLSLGFIQIVILFYLIPKLMKAKDKEDYGVLSKWMKVIMITGVLTPILLWI